MARKIKEKGRKYELLLFSLLFVFSEFFLFIYTLPTEVETPSDLLHPATAKELFTIENNVAPKHSTSFIGWSNYTAKKLFTIENNAAAKHSTSFLSSPNYTLSPIFHSPSFVRPSFKSIVEDHRHDIIVGDIQFLVRKS